MMGADQSAPAGETPKSSPRSSKGKGYGGVKDGGKDAAPKNEIVVVAEGATVKRSDPELQKLEEIPTAYPLIRSSLNQEKVRYDGIDKLDSRQLLQLCARYQDHLKQCAEAVAFDQNALCVRIKEIDYTANTLYNQLTERQRKFAKYAEQIQKVQEMQTILNKVKMNVEQTLPLMEKLNSVLPDEDKLEPFTMKPK